MLNLVVDTVVLDLNSLTAAEPETISYFVSTANRHTASTFQQSSYLILAMQHPHKEQVYKTSNITSQLIKITFEVSSIHEMQLLITSSLSLYYICLCWFLMSWIRSNSCEILSVTSASRTLPTTHRQYVGRLNRSP